MGWTVQATDGAMLPINSLAKFYEYSGSFISLITVNYQDKIYYQIWLNNGTEYTYISNWQLSATPPSGDIMITEDGDIMETESGDIMITE